MPDLSEQSLDELLNNVQAIAAVGSAPQIRSVMAVVAKSSQAVAQSLAAAATEIRAFNDSTTQLTNQVIALNRRLLWATWVIAIATGAVAVGTIMSALNHP